MVLAELIDSETMVVVAFVRVQMDLDVAREAVIMDDDVSQVEANFVVAVVVGFAKIVLSHLRNLLNTLSYH